MAEAKSRAKAARLPIVREIRALVTVQRQERDKLVQAQQSRWIEETRQRVARLPRGFKGIWHKATGDYAKVIRQNMQETKAAQMRDRQELHALVKTQLQERQVLQKSITAYQEEEQREAFRIRQEIARYVSTATAPAACVPDTLKADQIPINVQLTELETKIAMLSGDITQLQASLESNILSEEMRARVRRMIERTLETLHIKAIEEKQQPCCGTCAYPHDGCTRAQHPIYATEAVMEEKPLNWDSTVGELVLSDVIEWTETIWPARKPRRKSKPKPLGKQKVIGQITGIDGDFVTFTILRSAIIENPDRADIKPHTVGTALTKKLQTILKGEPQRLHWSEEDVRTALLANILAP